MAVAAEPASPSPVAITSFSEVIALAQRMRDLSVKTALERDLRLVRFEEGRLEIALEPGASKTLVNDLSRKLAEWTGRRWMVVVSAEAGEPTVKSQAEAQRAEMVRGVRADPLVQAVLARFPGAEIVDVRRRGMDALPPAPTGDDPDGADADSIVTDESSAFGERGAADNVDDDF
jgi:DNA polymerase-3 subunit gamma/tau